MKDVLDLELQLFLRGLLPQEDVVLQELRGYADAHHVPVVDPEVAHLLGLLVGLVQPEQVLEIGTAIGCSAIYMARAMQQGTITTIELQQERYELALENFKRAGVTEKIHAVLGDARVLVPKLEQQYDFIFMDAAKGQYQEFLTVADRILKPGGLLVADNVLLNGWVVDLNYPRHRQKTMVYRMKAFLEQFKENQQYQCSIIPLGDGVALIRKKRGGKNMKKPELLAPAGTLEKLKFAVQYGADAVYIAGKQYGLRAFAGNFTSEQMAEGIAFAHQRQVKVYVTVNVFAHNADFDGLEAYLQELLALGVDAIIVSDPGIIRIARQTVPDLPVHVSTQANVTNWSAVQFWKDMGAERVVLARELTLPEIKTIQEKVDIELETFVHGAMCISYSGRCLLSNYMTERDSNRGQCAQACRWNYHLVEEKRPNEFYPIQEDQRGSYVFNSQDLCLLSHLPELIETGICSLKIEGRMKSAYYVATIIRAYRNMIDACFEGAAVSDDIHFWMEELQKVSHRPYTTGFYFGKPEKGALTLEDSQYIRPYDFIGVVQDYDAQTGVATIEQRNHFAVGDTVEFFSPQYGYFQQEISQMWNWQGEAIQVAPHAQQIIKIPVVQPVYAYDLLRKPVKAEENFYKKITVWGKDTLV